MEKHVFKPKWWALFPILYELRVCYKFGELNIPWDIIYREIYPRCDEFYIQYHVLKSMRTNYIERKGFTLFNMVRDMLIYIVLDTKTETYNLLEEGYKFCDQEINIKSLIMAEVVKKYNTSDYAKGPIGFDEFTDYLMTVAKDMEIKIRADFMKLCVTIQTTRRLNNKACATIRMKLGKLSGFWRVRRIIRENFGSWTTVDCLYDSIGKNYTIPQQLVLSIDAGFNSISESMIYDLIHMMFPHMKYNLACCYIEYYVWLIIDTSYHVAVREIYVVCAKLLSESKIISYMEDGKMGLELLLLWVELVIKGMYLAMVKHYDGSLISSSYDNTDEGVKILIMPRDIKDALNTFMAIKYSDARANTLLKLWGMEQNIDIVSEHARVVCENL
jgi:hypothetical protein